MYTFRDVGSLKYSSGENVHELYDQVEISKFSKTVAMNLIYGAFSKASLLDLENYKKAKLEIIGDGVFFNDIIEYISKLRKKNLIRGFTSESLLVNSGNGYCQKCCELFNNSSEVSSEDRERYELFKLNLGKDFPVYIVDRELENQIGELVNRMHTTFFLLNEAYSNAVKIFSANRERAKEYLVFAKNAYRYLTLLEEKTNRMIDHIREFKFNSSMVDQTLEKIKQIQEIAYSENNKKLLDHLSDHKSALLLKPFDILTNERYRSNFSDRSLMVLNGSSDSRILRRERIYHFNHSDFCKLKDDIDLK